MPQKIKRQRVIEASIVKDSISEHGYRITTVLAKYPRFIHSELMTHRVFSRNAASSRAIPTKKMLEMVHEEPAMFEFYGLNKPGMQSTEEMTKEQKFLFERWWDLLATTVADQVDEINQHFQDRWGVTPHKQMINRALEPWLHMQTLITATEWDNFFELRCHEDAQPEIKVLADSIRDAIDGSEPELIKYGQWHIPFIQPEEEKLRLEAKLKVSTARCARTSYAVHGTGKVSTVEEDIKLHDRLVGSEPIHASPTEHQAQCMNNNYSYKNFKGWQQYRKYIESGISPVTNLKKEYPEFLGEF
jgi:thymidylate synthase ThyX